jgi:hypothetical protein
MGDADSCVVLLKKFVECLIDESFRLSIESTCCFVEDEDVRLLD